MALEEGRWIRQVALVDMKFVWRKVLKQEGDNSCTTQQID